MILNEATKTLSLELSDSDIIDMDEASGDVTVKFIDGVDLGDIVEVHFKEDEDNLVHRYKVTFIDGPDAVTSLQWIEMIDKTLNEAPMTDEERAAKEQQKFEKGQAKAQKKQDKQDKKDMKTAQKLVKRDMYPEFRNCLFYLQNPDGTFQEPRTQEEVKPFYDKISPAIINAVVTTKGGFFVRRGLQDLDERGIRMTKDNMEVPATQAVKWSAEDKEAYEEQKKKEAAAKRRKEQRAAKKAAEKETSKSDKTPADDKAKTKPADVKKTNPADMLFTDKLLTKFKTLAKVTGLKVLDATGKQTSPESVSLDNVFSYGVDINGGKYKLANWIKRAVSNDILKESYTMEQIKKNLTESPVISMDDEDMFDPSEFSVKNLIKKAETKEAEKVARMSREAAEAELKKVYDVVLPKFNNSIQRGDSPIKTLEVLFDELVPASGPAASVAGELVRAMMRILFRDFNDGDKFFEGYGIETCGSSAEYLFDNGFAEEIQNILDNAYYLEDDARYTAAINNLAEKVVNRIKGVNSLMYIVNETDSRDYSVDYIKEHQPTYNIEINGSDDIVNLVENGVLNAWDLNDYVEHVLSYENYFEGAVVDRPWSHNSTEVSVSNLTRDGYDELEDRIQNNLDGFWADLVAEHADELTDDYDDDYEEEEQDDE